MHQSSLGYSLTMLACKDLRTSGSFVYLNTGGFFLFVCLFVFSQRFEKHSSFFFFVCFVLFFLFPRFINLSEGSDIGSENLEKLYFAGQGMSCE